MRPPPECGRHAKGAVARGQRGAPALTGVIFDLQCSPFEISRDRTVIEVEQLRYVRLGTRNLPAAIDFAQRILGLQLIEKTDEQATFRSDFRDHTLVYEAGDPAQQSVGL